MEEIISLHRAYWMERGATATSSSNPSGRSGDDDGSASGEGGKMALVHRDVSTSGCFPTLLTGRIADQLVVAGSTDFLFKPVTNPFVSLDDGESRMVTDDEFARSLTNSVGHPIEVLTYM
jgi:hypothetical protein